MIVRVCTTPTIKYYYTFQKETLTQPLYTGSKLSFVIPNAVVIGRMPSTLDIFPKQMEKRLCELAYHAQLFREWALKTQRDEGIKLITQYKVQILTRFNTQQVKKDVRWQIFAAKTRYVRFRKSQANNEQEVYILVRCLE
ncbi:hypothetical protein GCK72_003794 [Caenorhabditis remanei]|uniref:Uncharacterized protein n=1 Tax=Caenorhabditis remanei TaxID=31234 RepID=A0A6A5H7X9_CAERE|nr:hypothetical protein GCK72_003794 [Caenorhabditis remanei]KAF1763848.1 hypothetical protein GCK72_003794 [Caenorhabditis remanei]